MLDKQKMEKLERRPLRDVTEEFSKSDKKSKGSQLALPMPSMNDEDSEYMVIPLTELPKKTENDPSSEMKVGPSISASTINKSRHKFGDW